MLTISVAPPVNENFTTDCNSQKEVSRHISCEEDGSFSVVQCKGKKCHCVDTETGERLNGMDFDSKMRDTINCTGGQWMITQMEYNSVTPIHLIACSAIYLMRFTPLDRMVKV